MLLNIPEHQLLATLLTVRDGSPGPWYKALGLMWSVLCYSKHPDLFWHCFLMSRTCQKLRLTLQTMSTLRLPLFAHSFIAVLLMKIWLKAS
jgi:hypothetical protein